MLILAACGSGPIPKGNDQNYTGPIAVSKNISLTYSHSATIKIRLRAPTRELYPDGNSVYPDSIYLYMYNDEGALTTTIVAQKAFHDMQKMLYTAMGGVVVENVVLGQKLETPVLNYNENTGRIYSDTLVKVTTPTEILTGTGLTAMQDFSSYEIKHPSGSFAVKK